MACQIAIATSLKANKDCPKCGRSAADTLLVKQREFESGAAVLICQCGYFSEISH